MNDKQKAVVSLSFASESCTAALSVLSSRSAGTSSSSPSISESTPELSVILRDFDSLLALIYGSATKIALALNPSSPEFKAAVSSLQDLAKHISGVAHCAEQLDPERHGATLTAEIISTAKMIVESTGAFVQTFMDIFVDGGSSVSGSRTGQSEGEFLVRTGSLHELISSSRTSPGVSQDNISAVRRKWKSDQASLEDGLQEVGQMIEDAEKDGDEDEDGNDQETVEDGWDELGLDSGGTKMDEDDLARTKSVRTLLRLATIYHKRISLDLLSSKSVFPTPSNTALDALTPKSAALLAGADDLIATLYLPQSPAAISEEITSLTETIDGLQKAVQVFFAPDAGEQGKGRMWFEACFDQIRTAVAKCRTLLADQTGDPADER